MLIVMIVIVIDGLMKYILLPNIQSIFMRLSNINIYIINIVLSIYIGSHSIKVLNKKSFILQVIYW